jgi:hypothetical protein
MKRYLATFAAALFAITIMSFTPRLSAQNAMSGQDDAGSGRGNGEALAKLQHMSTELQLTPAQKEQMKPIVMNELMQMKEVKADTSMPQMKKAMKMHQIADAADAKVKPILNPGQYQKYEQMRAQERQQMMQKMQQNR